MFCSGIYNFPTLRENGPDKDYSKSSLYQNLWELSGDLHYLLRFSLLTDYLIVHGKETIHCHKEILKNRSRWFRSQIEAAETKEVFQIEVSENKKTMDAVLFYIYSGNLRFLESLDVPLLDLYQAAKKYGLLSLERKLARIVKEKKLKEEQNTIGFLWKMKVRDYSSLTAECSVVDSFSLCGTDRWKVRMKPIPDDCKNGVYVERQMLSDSPRTMHIVVLSMSVINADGTAGKKFLAQTTIERDRESLITEFFTWDQAETFKKSLFPGGTLTLSCQLTICAKIGYLEKFHIETQYHAYLSDELTQLSDDMHRMQHFEKRTQDVKIDVSPSIRISVHGCVFFARTRLPYAYIQLLGRQARLGRIGWTSFINFLYTGQPRFLDDHGRDVFCAVNRLPFIEAKSKYSKYLSTNLNLENAFHVMCDAVKYGDYQLQNAAADFLAKKSNIVTDRKVWIRIASDKLSSVLPWNPSSVAHLQYPKLNENCVQE